MYFKVNLKKKKPVSCYCFKRMVFIELNFTVAFLLRRKTWNDRFASKLGGWGILKNGRGIIVTRGWFWNCGVDTPWRAMGVSDNKVVELRQDCIMIYCVKSFLKQKVKKNSRNVVVVVKCMSDLLSYSYKHMVSWVKFPESKLIFIMAIVCFSRNIFSLKWMSFSINFPIFNINEIGQ